MRSNSIEFGRIPSKSTESSTSNALLRMGSDSNHFTSNRNTLLPMQTRLLSLTFSSQTPRTPSKKKSFWSLVSAALTPLWPHMSPFLTHAVPCLSCVPQPSLASSTLLPVHSAPPSPLCFSLQPPHLSFLFSVMPLVLFCPPATLHHLHPVRPDHPP